MQNPKEKIANKLYTHYGKPLEKKHWGEYVAIGKNGKTVIAPTLTGAVKKAVAAIGAENFVFKVGDRFVATWL